MKYTLLTISFCAILITGFSQNKVILNDYSNLKKELVSIKSEAEDYAVDMKNNWKNDTLKFRGRTAYVKLSASVDGMIENFKQVIRKPKSINETVRTGINSDLVNLKTQMTGFNELYIAGSLAKGDPAPEKAFFSMLTTGMGLYNEIKNLVEGQREQVVKQFETDCKLKKWDQL